MQIREDMSGDEADFSMAPMIDVVFLLLIFFMVATTFVEREKEMDLELPQAESGQEAQHDLEEIIINLMEDGRMIVGGETLDDEALRARLTQAARRNPETPITIRGDKEVMYGQAVGLIDVCRLAGLVNVGLMTTGS